MESPPSRPRTAPLPSGTQGIAQALGGSEPLALLSRRLRESQARLEAIRPLLAPALRPHVRPGPIDDEGWALLVSNQPVAAKLRQQLPALQALLVEAGFADLPIRVRLLLPP